MDCDPGLPGINGDGIQDALDLCTAACDTAQLDSDGDGIGNACCPGPWPRTPMGAW